MAQIEVKVPQLSESVAEATLLSWHKKVGEPIGRDENMIDIETDKVVLELPAPSAGVIVQLLKGDGSTVVAGEVIAIIDTEASVQVSPLQVSSVAVAPAPTAAAAPQATSAPAATGGAMAGVAMPAASKILADNNMSATDVAGSGRDGRVTKGDALGAVASKPAVVAPLAAAPAKAALQQVAAPAAPKLGDRPEERVPMSRLRARIAERLVQSQSTNAILTTFNEVNMQPVIDLRNKYKDSFSKSHDVNLGFMSFFTKAVTEALNLFPAVNAQIDGNEVIFHNYADIGIAVSSPKGLMVPVVRNAEQLTLAEIEKEIKRLAVKARDGKITPDDMTGGTFTITNGGVFGSMMSTPIINPPQSAILGMHNIVERPVAINGKVEIRPMMYLALSYDHRIIDGKESVSFLVKVKEMLENPERMIFGGKDPLQVLLGL